MTSGGRINRDGVADFEVDDGEIIRLSWERARGVEVCEAAAGLAAFRLTLEAMEITVPSSLFEEYERDLLQGCRDRSVEHALNRPPREV